MIPSFFKVTDDSGFLGIIDPDSYQGFVDENWSIEDLVSHFKEQMQLRRLLIWGTGAEDIWRVEVNSIVSSVQGFREVAGTIVASRGRLCLSNYEALTMAAQFKDVHLPERHNRDLILKVAPGSYQCRIVQASNPDDNVVGNSEWDFLCEPQPDTRPKPAWTSIPWWDFEADSV